MLFLNKLLPVFVLPLGLVALLLLLALWRKKRWPVGAALVLLYGSSIPFTGDRLIGWVESRYPAVMVAAVEPADAVVALGGIFGPPAAPGQVRNLMDTGERLEAAIQLWQARKVSWVVFTGGRIPWENRIKVEGEESRDEAVRRGVPAERILVTREIDNTAGEAAAVADLMKERGWKKIILVTTGWHMPRSAYLFRKAGVECVIFPVDFRRDRQKKLTPVDFLPKAEALANTETALREVYGNLFYRLFR
jgi:uncharacterized SAM-binding protein YcdF (DUF218 family)